MSKAFTRESDGDSDELPPRPSSALPPGAKNFVTPDGAERLRAELGELVSETRPQLATTDDDDDARRRRLAQIDQRIEQLEESLRTAVIVPAPTSEVERREVRFGATVTVRRRNGEVTYRIVGVDETDLDCGWVSYLAPIAKALLGARLGERVRFHFPSGEEEIEVVAIGYEPPRQRTVT